MNKSLNIAIIDMDDLKNPFWGAGQARATREAGKRLAQRHSITVYCSKYPGYSDYCEDGLTYKHVGILHTNPQLTNLAFLMNIPLLVGRLNVDIIIENFNAPTSVSFAPLFTRIPIIGLPTMFNAIEFSKKYHIPFHWVESLGMKFYKYMMPYSETDSAKIRRLNKDIKYQIIPQGVGKEYFAIEQKQPQHILFLGRFDLAQKGIDLLIRSYAKVSKTIGIPLVIAGHGPDEDKIRKLVTNLNLNEYIHMIGPAYGESKYDLLAHALFVAFPSRHDELSLWALEVLASGVPLVAFDLPESKYISNQVALKAKPFDLDEYSSCLSRLTESQLNKRMRVDARILAKKYTWEKVANEFENFMFEVLNVNQLK